MEKLAFLKNKAVFFITLIVIILLAVFFLKDFIDPQAISEDYIFGNGRIEATELNIANKHPGRIDKILVKEGDYIKAGQPLVYMNTESLDAKLLEAQAKYQEVITAIAVAKAQVSMRISQVAAANANVVQIHSQLDVAQKRLIRAQSLLKTAATSQQDLDNNIAAVNSLKAQLNAVKAQVVAAKAQVKAAKSQVLGVEAKLKAVAASISLLQVEIKDSVLSSPRDARVQYLVFQAGEVVAAGSPILNVIDLADVYMTFFVPSQIAGKIALLAPARIILDAAAQYSIPAEVSYIASSAQFTPKTVETAQERQKLMFRVRAKIKPDLLKKYKKYVKIGLPGVTWIQLSSQTKWPEIVQETTLLTK